MSDLSSLDVLTNQLIGADGPFNIGRYQNVLADALNNLILMPNNTDFTPPEWRDLVDKNQTIFTPRHELPLTPSDMITLYPNQWISGEIIFAYLMEELGYIEGLSIFDTYFGDMLQKYEKEVLTQMLQDKARYLLSKEVFIIPLHIRGNHWAFVIVHKSCDMIEYYDSLLQWDITEHRVYITNLLRKLHDFLIFEKILTSPVTTKIVTDTPQQPNLTDCGLFVCRTAVAVLRNYPLDFNLQDLGFFRRIIADKLLGRDTAKLLLLQPQLLKESYDKQSNNQADNTTPVNNLPPHQQIESRICNTTERLFKKRYEELLEHLSMTDLPYLDYNSKGKLVTQNFTGNYKDCRKMSEVIHVLRKKTKKNATEIWKYLAEEVKKDDRFLMEWVSKISDTTTPLSFLPGSKGNSQRLRRLMKLGNITHLNRPPYTENKVKNKRKKPSKKKNKFQVSDLNK